MQGDQTSRFERDSPVFSLDFKRPDFFSDVPFFIFFALNVRTYVKIKIKNTLVKETINPDSLLWLKK